MGRQMTKGTLIHTMIDKALDLLKKGIKGYFSRLYSAFKYFLEVVLAAGINSAIMIPLSFGTYFLMQHLGYNMELPTSTPDIDPSILGDGLIPLIALCLSIGIMEETLCRYLIQDCMLEKFGKLPWWASWVIASVFFGLIHLGNPGSIAARMPQAIGAIGAGFWFGYIYRKKGLHFAIMTHALYDFVIIWASLQ
jgi:membrane protease YdiL (CAAX protease family)